MSGLPDKPFPPSSTFPSSLFSFCQVLQLKNTQWLPVALRRRLKSPALPCFALCLSHWSGLFFFFFPPLPARKGQNLWEPLSHTQCLWGPRGYGSWHQREPLEGRQKSKGKNSKSRQKSGYEALPQLHLTVTPRALYPDFCLDSEFSSPDPSVLLIRFWNSAHVGQGGREADLACSGGGWLPRLAASCQPWRKSS